jgi:hypothetical protein
MGIVLLYIHVVSPFAVVLQDNYYDTFKTRFGTILYCYLVYTAKPFCRMVIDTIHPKQLTGMTEISAVAYTTS